ncbi:hypothetical protein NM688_g2691 [Phlebia brevispora]|uniref:Uncharacterized protein n=1 Tax=Phlebia brevispora TaxID=194682 RepID=A0ACC1T832_9APHY|nr:hypothetical protein NM688_g2691 [Phlebia brevispora]
MGTAVDIVPMASAQQTDDDEGSDAQHATNPPRVNKSSLRLPSFLASDFAVVILFVASLACIVGLTRQLLLLWEMTRDDRILEMSMKIDLIAVALQVSPRKFRRVVAVVAVDEEIIRLAPNGLYELCASRAITGNRNASLSAIQDAQQPSQDHRLPSWLGPRLTEAQRQSLLDMDLIPNAAIEVFRPEFSGSVKYICIIGAGPSGLGALKVIRESPQYKAGLWKPVAFEARDAIGGVWVPAPPTDNPPLTPLYDSLTTNVPHPLMAFPGFPFPPSTNLFPPASVVRTYLESYAAQYALNQYVRLRTTVRLVDWDANIAKWRVRTSATSAGPDEATDEALFDHIIIANGHYSKPFYPDTPGLRAWLDAGKAMHSAWYRHPDNLGDTVLVLGGGPSGIDVADEMRTSARTVIHSVPGVPRADSEGGSLKKRGRIIEFLDAQEGRVRYEDGTSDTGIDYCILATGYEHSLPFLPPSLLELSLPPPIPPIPTKLYNSKFHIFPLAKQMFPLFTSLPAGSLAFVVLNYRILPFPLVEAQMHAVLKVFAEPNSLDPAQEAVDIVSYYEALRASVGDNAGAIAREWHKLDGASQFDYMDDVNRFAGGEYASEKHMVPSWFRELWEHKWTIRREWKEIVKAGEAEKWTAGVGASGGEEGTKEWVDLMWRIVHRAEHRQASNGAGRETRL